MTERKYVFTSVEKSIFLITIDHPPVNTLSTETLAEMESVIDEFISDPTCKVAIISGGDKVVFVSGADLLEAQELNASGNIKGYILRGQELIRKILECPKPIIAAINGIALGGGGVEGNCGHNFSGSTIYRAPTIWFLKTHPAPEGTG